MEKSLASALLSAAASHCRCERIAGDAGELGARALDGEGGDPMAGDGLYWPKASHILAGSDEESSFIDGGSYK